MAELTNKAEKKLRCMEQSIMVNQEAQSLKRILSLKNNHLRKTQLYNMLYYANYYKLNFNRANYNNHLLI